MAKCAHFEVCGIEADAIPEGGHCILHAEDPDKDREAFAEALEAHLATGTGDFRLIYFCGTVSFKNHTFEKRADFSGAMFEKMAHFNGATFEGKAQFRVARFNGWADFNEVTFNEEADFNGAIFRWADFNEATFNEGADFSQVTFNEKARLNGARFNGWADFNEATFNERAEFSWAKFEKRVRFRRAIFKEADFRSAMFEQAVFTFVSFEESNFYGASFERASFSYAAFNKKATFSEATFKQVDFFKVTFEEVAFVRVTFGGANFVKTTFNGQANFSQCTFRGSALFEGFDQRALFAGADEIGFRYVTLDPLGTIAFRNADLRRCRFLNTDARKIEFTSVAWCRKPSRWPRGKGTVCVYDELCYDNDAEKEWGRLERLYRELKQNYEDRKDYARAGDFHFREKEMRKHNPDTPPGHKALLWLYWGISGYGERIWPAVGWLFAIIFGCAALYLAAGIAPAGYGSTLLYSAQTSFLLQPDGYALEEGAQWVRLFQTVLSPILLGLIALAVRQRLKR